MDRKKELHDAITEAVHEVLYLAHSLDAITGASWWHPMSAEPCRHQWATGRHANGYGLQCSVCDILGTIVPREPAPTSPADRHDAALGGHWIPYEPASPAVPSGELSAAVFKAMVSRPLKRRRAEEWGGCPGCGSEDLTTQDIEKLADEIAADVLAALRAAQPGERCQWRWIPKQELWVCQHGTIGHPELVYCGGAAPSPSAAGACSTCGGKGYFTNALDTFTDCPHCTPSNAPDVAQGRTLNWTCAKCSVTLSYAPEAWCPSCGLWLKNYAPQGGSARRIEGIAFMDGDAFCGGDDGETRCQESYVFVPECEHEGADVMTNHENLRASLLIHDAPPPASESPDVRKVGNQWFMLPSGPGSDVGPFSTEAEAWAWMEAVRPASEPVPVGMCVCGHPESEHAPEYWPKERNICRVGGVDEDDIGWRCPCVEYTPQRIHPRARRERENE